MSEEYSKTALEKRHPFVQYGCAVATVALTTLLRKSLAPLLGDHDIFIVYLPAVMITSWIGGLVPGLAALLLGILAGIWFFIPPIGTWVVRVPIDATGITIYIAAGLMIAVSNEAQQRAQQRAEKTAAEMRRHEEALRTAHAELERRVRERTAELTEANTTLHGEVHERKRTEDALRVSEARMAGIIGSAMDAIVSADVEQHIVLFNAAAERMFRCAAAEAIGQPINRFVPERFHEAHTKSVDLYGQTGVTSRSHGSPGSLVALRANGEEFPIEATISQAQVADQKIYTAIVRDISERRRAESALHKSESRYRRLADTAYEGIWTIDSEGRIDYVNTRMAEMLDYAPEEAIGHSLFDFSFEEDTARSQRELERQREGIAEQHEIRLRRKDGSELWVVASNSPIQENGKYTGTLGMFTEITDRKRVEEALRAYARQQAEVAALGRRALAGGDLLDLLDEAVAIVVKTLQVEYCKVLELLPDTSALLLRAGVGWKEGVVGKEIVSAETGSQANHTLNSGEPVIVVDLRTDKRFRGPSLLLDHGVISGVSVIIQGPSRPYGVLGAHTSQRRTFTDDDVSFLESVANILASAIERKRSEQVANNHTEALVQTLNALVTNPELDVFLEQVLRAITEYLRAASAALWFYDGTQDALSLFMVNSGGRVMPGLQSDHPFAAQPLSVRDNPLWSEMVKARQPLFIESVAQDSHIPYREWLLAQGIESLLLVPMVLGTEAVGWFSVWPTDKSPYRPEELALAQALAQQATIAVQLTRLADQGRRAAILQERNRMAQEIHDTLAQGFTGVLIQLEAAKSILIQQPEEATAHILLARDLARESLAEARRSVHALRPQALEDSNLPNALARLIERMTTGAPIEAKFQVHGAPRLLPPDTEHNLLRIGTEALTNALKHAQASEIRITLAFEEMQVRLSVQDNGIGFDFSDQTDRGGFGLTSMRERAECLGSELTVRSAPGIGTTVTVAAPISASQDVESLP